MEALLEQERAERSSTVTVTKGSQTSGILVVNRAGSVLHLNEIGWELIRDLHGGKDKGIGLLPAAITELCDELTRRLETVRSPEERAQLEFSCMAEGSQGTILLRALPLMEGGDKASQSERTLIILEPVHAPHGRLDRKKEEFGLTEREREVADGLLRGWTNKEIANHLGITEPTVKAHISHIMQKMKCTTRTAIVGQLLVV